MALPAGVRQFIRELVRRINDNPTWVTRYILSVGDGISTQNSWYFTDSFKASEDNVNRNQWFTFTTDGSASRRISVITVPVTALSTDPAVGQKITLADQNGNAAGNYRINFVEGLRWRGVIYAWQLTCETA